MNGKIVDETVFSYINSKNKKKLKHINTLYPPKYVQFGGKIQR